MAKLNYQQPLLQSSVSRDPLEIILLFWFDAQKKIFDYKVQKNSIILNSKLL